MLAQIFAVVIFITMFVFIVTEIVERHIVSLISALLTMIFVFGIGMQSMEAIWETLNISSIFSPGFWYAGAASHGSAAGINWETIVFIFGMMVMVEGMAHVGFFRWLCMRIAKMVKYKIVPIFFTFMILSFICVGSFYVKPENWTPFFPADPSGIIMGAFLIFFAYIGFDAISTAAEETKNPQRDLPVAILGTLVICTILYVCVALVLTGIVPVGNIDINAPIAHAMSYIGKDWFAGALSLGALCALTSVLLIYQLGTTRILFAISRDRFLPKSWRLIHKKFRTPHVMTWISGLIVIICGLFMDLNISLALANFGTFTSFVIICLIVLILRKIEPNRERPFKVPFCPWFPILGIIICGVLIVYSFNELKTSSKYFVWWLIIGVLIYALYGYHQKRLEERKRLGKKA